MKLGQTICRVEISAELEGKCVMSVKKLGQILDKPPSRKHIFNMILMKFGQNVCLEISDTFENG